MTVIKGDGEGRTVIDGGHDMLMDTFERSPSEDGESPKGCLVYVPSSGQGTREFDHACRRGHPTTTWDASIHVSGTPTAVRSIASPS